MAKKAEEFVCQIKGHDWLIGPASKHADVLYKICLRCYEFIR